MMTFRHAPLPSRALVALKGPDWRAFLQGLLTQDVLTLAPGELRFGALLTPQGKLLFDLFLIGREDGCLLDVRAEWREALVQRLAIYRLRAKVEILPVAGAVSALWPSPSAAPGDLQGSGCWSPDPRLPLLGWRGVDEPGPSEAGSVDERAYDAHRLALGVPDPPSDCVPDKTYPIEANFDLLHGIDFGKGCFVGQETTSRMKRRGQIKTRMLPIRFEGPPPPFGAEVLAGELRAGEVLSGREGAAMALLRLDRIQGAQLTAAGKAVRAEAPSWHGLPPWS